MQAGNSFGYGDETGDGAYGFNSRPSHGCETIPSTIGAMPASKGLSGGSDFPPPPTAICVPFAGPPCVLLRTIDGSGAAATA
jgi:hypothetical protein